VWTSRQATGIKKRKIPVLGRSEGIGGKKGKILRVRKSAAFCGQTSDWKSKQFSVPEEKGSTNHQGPTQKWGRGVRIKTERLKQGGVGD